MALKVYVLSMILSFALIGSLIYTYDRPAEANLRSTHENVKIETHHHECVHDAFMKDKKIISFDLEASPIEATLDHEKELRK